MALVDVLRTAGVEQADFLRGGVRVLAQELMDLEVAEDNEYLMTVGKARPLAEALQHATTETQEDRYGERRPFHARLRRRARLA